MRILVSFAVALMASALLMGCSSEVDSSDVKEWENQGRAPGDKPIDPNSGQDR